MTTILLLSLLILLHEFGHFVVAKIFGIRVDEFGIGIPPKALKLFKWKETEFTLNYLPLGGFVRLAGEDQDPTLWEKINPFIRRTMFFAKPAWQRALVVVAGVFMNFVVGVLSFSIIYSVLGVPRNVGNQVMIADVIDGSPAKLADLKAGEVVKKVDEIEIENSTQFVDLIHEQAGTPVNLWTAEVDANGNTSDSLRVVTIVPRDNPPEGQGALGVSVTTVPILSYEKLPWYKAPFAGMVEGTKEAWLWGVEFVRLIIHPAELIKNVGGPVKVYEVGQQAVAQGWSVALRFVGIISLNLAIFNLLPIPALDGGRLLMIGLEKVVGRKKIAKIEQYVNAVGMGLLILLLIVITIKDIFFG